MENNLPTPNTEVIPPPSTPPSVNPPAPEMPTQTGSRKKLFIIIGCAALVGIIIVAVILGMVFSKPKNVTTTKNETTITKTEQEVKTYPKFQFTYTAPETIPNVPASLLTYALKTSFTEPELASFGAKFGFTKPESIKEGQANFSDLTNTQTLGYLILDTNTGGFEYQNMGQSTKIEGDIKTGAREFLSKIGLQDNLIDCDITYQNSLVSDVTFVECHRSWEKLGAPLLNLPGVLNIAESTPLSTLKVGYNNTPLENPSIVNVSTGQNGVSRPNDFNTATFAISSDGNILSIISNLRWITDMENVNSLNPQEAFNSLKKNGAVTTVATPAGLGKFEWNQVFPEGSVSGKNATISGYELVYVENELQQEQKSYVPTYLFRGNVMLDTGYKVNFVQTVTGISNQVASQQTADDIARDNLQLQTFTVAKKTPTVTPTKAIAITATPLTPTPMPYDCSLDSNIRTGVSHRGYVEPVIRYTVNINGAPVSLANNQSSPNVFFIGEKTTSAADVNKYRTGFNKILAEQFAWNYKNGKTPNAPALPDASQGMVVNTTVFYAVQGIYNSLINNPSAVINPQLSNLTSHTALFITPSSVNNPCYLTGISPSIFLYSENHTLFTISPSHAMYSDPYLMKNTWNVQAEENGILTSGNFTKEFLYYEFNPVKVNFLDQEKGFIVKKSELGSLIQELAAKMKLNEKETTRLEFEFNHALASVNSAKQYIKVSLVPTNELNEKLPLGISPKPKYANRYHFMLEGLDSSKNIAKPTIPTVKRGSSTLVEIGASGK